MDLRARNPFLPDSGIVERATHTRGVRAVFRIGDFGFRAKAVGQFRDFPKRVDAAADGIEALRGLSAFQTSSMALIVSWM